MRKYNKGRGTLSLIPPARASTGGLNFMTKAEKTTVAFLLLSFGWILGRFTEAMAVGNIRF